MIDVLSLRGHPQMCDAAIAYFQAKWACDDSRMVYDDCIRHSLTTENPLPRWYLLTDGSEIIGCAGLITNDFISRMDLYPWICALYVEESHRGQALGQRLLARAEADAKAAGFSAVYLCTDHIGYYEHYGYAHIGTGWHPWGETSRIYEKKLI